MSDTEPTSDGIPKEIEQRNTTGSVAILNLNNDRVRLFLRIIFAGILVVLIIGDIFMYSVLQTLKARVENQEHRIDRLNHMIDNVIQQNQNAEKIEKINQQVEGIDGQVQEMTDALKAQDVPQL